MNLNNKIEKFERKEGEMEKEKFEPQIIFDFIRHGEAAYGKELEEEIEDLGYKWEKLMSSSKVSEEKLEGKAIREGDVTPKGEEQLRESIGSLVEKIDKDNEVVMLLSSPLFRAAKSSEIILEELEKQGIDVGKKREHKSLVELNKHWISVLEFVKKETKGKVKDPFNYWLKMSDEEIREADLESLEGIGDRMQYFIEVIKRYGRRYKDQLRLDDKKLRVIAVTHDVNILSILKAEGVSLKDAGTIKNAQFIEMGVDEKGKAKLMKQPQ
jgi:broad specificity phosphatase PhoE